MTPSRQQLMITMLSMVRKNNMSSKKLILKVMGTLLFVIYGCVLIYFLFFAEGMGRRAGNDYSLNLVPFKEIKRFITHMDVLGSEAVWMNIGGNIAAFIPFGFFVVPVAGLYIKSESGVGEAFIKAVIMTFNISICVEVIQLISKVGSFDVDDLILNTLGGIIGAGVYALYSLAERKRSDGKA